MARHCDMDKRQTNQCQQLAKTSISKIKSRQVTNTRFTSHDYHWAIVPLWHFLGKITGLTRCKAVVPFSFNV